MSAPYIRIRRASGGDAAGITKIYEAVVSERVHSAIDRAWDVEEQRRHLESLPERAAVFVAVDGADGITGCQTLDPYSSLTSMSHVGAIGTFLLPEWRRRKVGKALFQMTNHFAISAGYRKL